MECYKTSLQRVITRTLAEIYVFNLHIFKPISKSDDGLSHKTVNKFEDSRTFHFSTLWLWNSELPITSAQFPIQYLCMMDIEVLNTVILLILEGKDM